MFSLALNLSPLSNDHIFTMHYLLPMHPSPLYLILTSQKTHEFRSYHLPDATHLWLYVTAPVSAVRYILKVGTPITRDSVTLPESPSPQIDIPTDPCRTPPSAASDLNITYFRDFNDSLLLDLENLKFNATEDEKFTGNGNRDFNRGQRGFAFGYPVEEVWELKEPVTLEMIRKGEGMGVKCVPRGRARVPDELGKIWEMEGAVWRVRRRGEKMID